MCVPRLASSTRASEHRGLSGGVVGHRCRQHCKENKFSKDTPHYTFDKKSLQALRTASLCKHCAQLLLRCLVDGILREDIAS